MVEYAQYGDLLGYLRKSRGVRDNYYSDPSVEPRTSLTSKQLLRFAWQISDGMDYLSKRKVMNSLLIFYGTAGEYSENKVVKLLCNERSL